MKQYFLAVGVVLAMSIPATGWSNGPSVAKKEKARQTEVPKSTPGGGKPLTTGRVSMGGSVAVEPDSVKAGDSVARTSAAGASKKNKMLKFNPKDEQKPAQ